MMHILASFRPEIISFVIDLSYIFLSMFSGFSINVFGIFYQCFRKSFYQCFDELLLVYFSSFCIYFSSFGYIFHVFWTHSSIIWIWIWDPQSGIWNLHTPNLRPWCCLQAYTWAPGPSLPNAWSSSSFTAVCAPPTPSQPGRKAI